MVTTHVVWRCPPPLKRISFHLRFRHGCGINPLQCVGGQLADPGNGVVQCLEQDRDNNLRPLRIMSECGTSSDTLR
jgi:hypothetical protein